MGLRVISMESKSKVYHRSSCRYVNRVQKKNLMEMKWEDAEHYGYRPCLCCDGINYLYHSNLGNIKAFCEQNKMDIDLRDNKIYVRTDVGCWKLIYIFKDQRFILMHKNHVEGRLSMDEVEHGGYHRQGDMPYSGSIMKYLNYIKKHDEFKRKMPDDIKQMPTDTKKQKAYYKTAKRREDRRAANRLESLFLMIERKEGIKHLSFC